MDLTSEEQPWHLAANRSCRSQRPAQSRSRRAAADRRPPRRPARRRPIQTGCQRMTSSVTGRNRRCGHSAHLIRGFSQMPRTHSLAHAGAVPRLAARPALESPRVHVHAPSEQRLEERNLLGRRGVRVDRCWIPTHGHSCGGRSRMWSQRIRPHSEHPNGHVPRRMQGAPLHARRAQSGRVVALNRRSQAMKH